MNKIYKAKNGKYIDLSTIIAIGPIVHNEFNAECQLMDKGVWFSFSEHQYPHVDRLGDRLQKAEEDCANCREDLIKAWKEYNGEGE